MRLIKLRAMKRINGLHYAPDGRRLLAVGGAEVRMQDEAVWVEVIAGTEAERVSLGGSCYAVSADLKSIAVGEPLPYYSGGDDEDEFSPVVRFNPTEQFWYAKRSLWQTVIPAARTATEVYALAFHPKGKQLVVSYSVANRCGYHTSALIAYAKLGRKVEVETHEWVDDSSPTAISYSPDGKKMAFGGGTDGPSRIEVYDHKSLTPLAVFRPRSGRTFHLAFFPDSAELAVVNGKAVYLLPADSDVPRFTLAHPKQANQVAFTPDGRRILSACHDGLLRIWDTATGQLVTSYDWGIGQTTAVAVSPDGLTAAAAGQKGQIVLFDLD